MQNDIKRFKNQGIERHTRQILIKRKLMYQYKYQKKTIYVRKYYKDKEIH